MIANSELGTRDSGHTVSSSRDRSRFYRELNPDKFVKRI